MIVMYAVAQQPGRITMPNIGDPGLRGGGSLPPNMSKLQKLHNENNEIFIKKKIFKNGRNFYRSGETPRSGRDGSYKLESNVPFLSKKRF